MAPVALPVTCREEGDSVTVMELQIPADLSADDLEELPDEGHRYELHEGNLVIMSPATAWHYRAGMRLVLHFEGKGRHVTGEVGIKFGHRDVRTPDVAVFHGPFDDSRAMFPPSDIAIAVEVVSPSSEVEDRVTKPWVYAHAGIPEYWRVERIEGTDDAFIYQFVLERSLDGEPAYRQSGQTTLSELEKGAG
jgi:Uma2 family endonuclease